MLSHTYRAQFVCLHKTFLFKILQIHDLPHPIESSIPPNHPNILRTEIGPLGFCSHVLRISETDEGDESADAVQNRTCYSYGM